jgi:hypothetical protein
MNLHGACRGLVLLALLWAGPVTAQQFPLPEDLSPDGLNTGGLSLDTLEGDADRSITRPGERVQRAQEIVVVSATGATLRALDRISGETTDIELAVGAHAETGNGRLTVTLMDCRYPQDDPSSNAYAYVTVQDKLRSDLVFQGWMIAASPALNALDHARYDVWLLRCNNS